MLEIGPNLLAAIVTVVVSVVVITAVDDIISAMMKPKRDLSKRVFNVSIRVAERIMADCMDRRGIKWEFEKLDEEVTNEITHAWRKIVVEEIEKENVR